MFRDYKIHFEGDTCQLNRLEKLIHFFVHNTWSTSPFDFIKRCEHQDYVVTQLQDWILAVTDSTGELLVIQMAVDHPFSGGATFYLQHCIGLCNGSIIDEYNDHPNVLEYPELAALHQNYKMFITSKYGKPLYDDYNYTEIFDGLNHIVVWQLNDYDMILRISSGVFSDFDFGMSVVFIPSSHRLSTNPTLEKYIPEDDTRIQKSIKIVA